MILTHFPPLFFSGVVFQKLWPHLETHLIYFCSPWLNVCRRNFLCPRSLLLCLEPLLALSIHLFMFLAGLVYRGALFLLCLSSSEWHSMCLCTSLTHFTSSYVKSSSVTSSNLIIKYRVAARAQGSGRHRLRILGLRHSRLILSVQSLSCAKPYT